MPKAQSSLGILCTLPPHRCLRDLRLSAGAMDLSLIVHDGLLCLTRAAYFNCLPTSWRPFRPSPESLRHRRSRRKGSACTSGKWVVRPNNHAEGSDFELLDAPFTVASGKHATKFIEDTREYRVWFIRDKYLVAKRVPRSSEGQTQADPCRSKWGYAFCEGVFEMDKARMAIPLDFGAADVLWKDTEGVVPGQWYFLEFNSAPSLDHDKVLNHFQTRLQAILATLGTRDVAEPVPTRESASNRQPERPAPTPLRHGGLQATASDWESRFKAELAAKVEARKRAIEEEFYRSL